eukprot:10967452-Ditylum_brightwellii.AAC.1
MLWYEREGPPLVERGSVVRNRRAFDGNTDANAYETSSNTISQHAFPPMYTPHSTIDTTMDNPLTILADASDILRRKGGDRRCCHYHCSCCNQYKYK